MDLAGVFEVIVESVGGYLEELVFDGKGSERFDDARGAAIIE